MNNDQKTRPEKFWDRMFELYGMKWANSYGTEPSKLWIETIDALPNHKIKRTDYSAFLRSKPCNAAAY